MVQNIIARDMWTVKVKFHSMQTTTIKEVAL
jgi:hypothetical protein